MRNWKVACFDFSCERWRFVWVDCRLWGFEVAFGLRFVLARLTLNLDSSRSAIRVPRLFKLDIYRMVTGFGIPDRG